MTISQTGRLTGLTVAVPDDDQKEINQMKENVLPGTDTFIRSEETGRKRSLQVSSPAQTRRALFSEPAEEEYSRKKFGRKR